MERKSIEQASAEEVREFARIAFGLDIASGAHKTTVMAQLEAVGYISDEITIYDPTQPTQSTATAGTVKNEQGKDCYRILIPEEDKAGGQEPVPVSVQGSAMLVPRGKPCLVPVAYVEALQNAVSYFYERSEGPLGGIGRRREVPAIPYQILPAA